MSDIMWSSIITAVILVTWAIIFWYFRKPKSKVAICWHCKYCVKARWWQARINKQITCRTPSDPVETNYLTGKKSYPKFSCTCRNLHGTCPDYKKVWWKLNG